MLHDITLFSCAKTYTLTCICQKKQKQTLPHLVAPPEGSFDATHPQAAPPLGGAIGVKPRAKGRSLALQRLRRSTDLTAYTWTLLSSAGYSSQDTHWMDLVYWHRCFHRQMPSGD